MARTIPRALQLSNTALVLATCVKSAMAQSSLHKTGLEAKGKESIADSRKGKESLADSKNVQASVNWNECVGMNGPSSVNWNEWTFLKDPDVINAERTFVGLKSE